MAAVAEISQEDIINVNQYTTGQFILGLALLDLEEPEGAYTAFCRAAKGVSTEPFLRHLVAAPDARLTQHQALVLYYMKVHTFVYLCRALNVLFLLYI